MSLARTSLTRSFRPVQTRLVSLHTSLRPFSSAPNPASNLTTPPPTSPRARAYLPRLTALSQRTGVPLPSLVLSFLVLHELTAFLPLILLFFLFQAAGAGAGFVGWIASATAEPSTDISRGGPSGAGVGGVEWKEWVKSWYDEGAKRAEGFGRRYGLWGFEKGSKKGEEVVSVTELEKSAKTSKAAAAVADAVSAYVLVKALFPVRIGISIAAAPAFARFAFLPVQRLAKRLFQS